jgi:uncharacterized membrane protein
VLVGSVDRIFKMAEKEQGFRQTMMRRRDTFQAGLTLVGQILGFLIGMSGIGGGVYLVHSDKSITGFAVFFTSLAALVSVFIVTNSRAQSQKAAQPTTQPNQKAAAATTT